MASSARKVIDSIIAFIEVKTEQIKLRIIAALAKLLSGVLSAAILAVLAFFFLFFLSFAFAEMINTGLSSDYLGYLIIAGAYLIIILIILALLKSRKLQNWIEAIIVKIDEARNEQEEAN